MIYPERFEQKIGFTHIREAVKGHCISAMGLERAETMDFSNDREAIERSLGVHAAAAKWRTLSREGLP